MQSVDTRWILGAAYAAVPYNYLGGGIRKNCQAGQQSNGKTSGKPQVHMHTPLELLYWHARRSWSHAAFILTNAWLKRCI